MDKQRAIDISESPNLKHVTFQGEPVYIQHVDEQNNLARIYLLDEPEKEFDVHIQQLYERH